MSVGLTLVPAWVSLKSPPGFVPSLAIGLFKGHSHMHLCGFLCHTFPAAYSMLRGDRSTLLFKIQMTLHYPWGLTSRNFLLQASLLSASLSTFWVSQDPPGDHRRQNTLQCDVRSFVGLGQTIRAQALMYRGVMGLCTGVPGLPLLLGTRQNRASLFTYSRRGHAALYWQWNRNREVHVASTWSLWKPVSLSVARFPCPTNSAHGASAIIWPRARGVNRPMMDCNMHEQSTQ